MVFVGSSDRFVYAIDAATGGLVWRYETGDSVQAGPTYEDGVIHIGSRDNTLYSLVADTGQLRWNYTATDDPDITPVSISIKQTAAVTENRVFFGSTNTYFYALNRFDGTHQWSRETEQSINSAPALWNDTVYFASMLGTLYAMETKTGEIRWTSDRLHSPVHAHPSVNDGTLYIGDRLGTLRAFDARTGDHLWKFKTDNTIQTKPLVTEDTIYFGSNDGHVCAIEREI